MEVTFDTETIRLITLFENSTGVSVKDCFEDNPTNTVYYLVEEGKVGLAIGKGGMNVKRVENLLAKNVKVFEFCSDVATFVKRLIPQTQEVKIKTDDGKTDVEIRVDRSGRAVVIGRDGKNLKLYRELLQRNYKINDLIVR